MTHTRLQGTDGVRRHVLKSTDPSLDGLTPQESFLQKGVITEQFMELYTYCRVKRLMDNETASIGDKFVIGWDPRDPEGSFTDCAVAGIVKAGGTAVVVGISPTPAITIYMRAIGAAGAFAITASHNPASYNGIKIFTRRCLKLLPGDDLLLSDDVITTDYNNVKNAEPLGEVIDRHDEMVSVFTDFSLAPENSWIEKPDVLANHTLVLDCCNGAFSEMGEDICKKAGFNEVIALNRSLAGDVNVKSGVAELEGISEVTRDMLEQGGRLHGNKAMETVLGLGAKEKERIKNGELTLSAGVFDGDGDRFFRVDYNFAVDSGFVLTGDETSILQASFIRKESAGRKFVNTVESDLGAIQKAGSMGYDTKFTAVGDKWILLEAVLSAVRPNASSKLMGEIEAIANSEFPESDKIEELLDKEKIGLAHPSLIDFAVGAEESGHNISAGVIDTDNGFTTVFAGNGLKSLLNTFASTAQGFISEIPGSALRLDTIRHPFESGFKKTLYTYYVNKIMWQRGTPLWKNVKPVIQDSVTEKWHGVVLEEMTRPEDKDMLYIKVLKAGCHIASIFIRNSGTEDKIGVTLRGGLSEKKKLLQIGEATLHPIIMEMKNRDDKMAQAEIELVKTAFENGVPENPVCGLDKSTYGHLLSESGLKQGFLTGTSAGSRLTALGKWYHSILTRDD